MQLLPSEAYQLAKSYHLGAPQVCYRRGWLRTLTGLTLSLSGLYGGYQLLLYGFPLLFYYFGEREGSFYVLGPFTRYDAVFETDGSVIDLAIWARSHAWCWLLLFFGTVLSVSAFIVLCKVTGELFIRERVYVCVEGIVWLKGVSRAHIVLRWDEIHELRSQKEELYERYHIPPAQRVFLLTKEGQSIALSFTGLREIIEENLAKTRLTEVSSQVL
ncbi:hypothetical protein [Ktedonospora formicarum]|uniref:Uncharacterized protein n=1 Tax=Ktedonospora formicarum TaxID=2778364 RepID=A0A8J3MU99_9CHLR|nr:hypothetical protein [Ktedonospora formicarum]GHO46408.1 hypothetical protein KSX_45710 [Ktedonospora formicarum]